MFKKCNILYKIHWRTKGTQDFSIPHVICEQKLLLQSTAVHPSSSPGFLQTRQGDCMMQTVIRGFFFSSVQIRLKKKKNNSLNYLEVVFVFFRLASAL